MYTLGPKSKEELSKIHPHLIKIVKRAIQITKVDFIVNDGLRTVEEQEELCKTGTSKTMNSRHITGHAVDLVAWINNTVSWKWKYYYPIAKAVKKAAEELSIPIEWGGEIWGNDFRDGPHFQLSWKDYPINNILPININIYKEGNLYFAESKELHVYEHGNTRMEAFQAFLKSYEYFDGYYNNPKSIESSKQFGKNILVYYKHEDNKN